MHTRTHAHTHDRTHARTHDRTHDRIAGLTSRPLSHEIYDLTPECNGNTDTVQRQAAPLCSSDSCGRRVSFGAALFCVTTILLIASARMTLSHFNGHSLAVDGGVWACSNASGGSEHEAELLREVSALRQSLVDAEQATKIATAATPPIPLDRRTRFTEHVCTLLHFAFAVHACMHRWLLL